MFAAFLFGVSIAPLLAVVLGHFGVSLLSLVFALAGLVIVVFCFSETLPPEAAQRTRFFKDEEGVVMIEYALIAALIGVALIATLILLAGELNDTIRYLRS